jgi:hypothetical protein
MQKSKIKITCKCTHCQNAKDGPWVILKQNWRRAALKIKKNIFET